jgi:4-aminobutyrate aminotransferase
MPAGSFPSLENSDEIQAGAGRTGKMWAIEHAGVKPDGLLFGKGMGGDLPMAGFVLRADLARKIPAMSQPNTFAANALSAAVCARAVQVGAEAMQRLRAADSPLIGEVRGRGLMIGIELVEDRASRTPLSGRKMERLVGGCLEKGVIMVPCGRNGNVLCIMPSLTIPRSYLFAAIDIALGVIKGLT